MTDTTLLNQIGILIETKLDEKLEPIKQDLSAVKHDLNTVKEELTSVKQQLDTVEVKIELVNKRIEQSQEETIDAFSELINTGYNMHEKRIKQLEEKVQSSHPQ